MPAKRFQVVNTCKIPGKKGEASVYPLITGTAIDAALYALHVELESARRQGSEISAISVDLNYHGQRPRHILDVAPEE